MQKIHAAGRMGNLAAPLRSCFHGAFFVLFVHGVNDFTNHLVHLVVHEAEVKQGRGHGLLHVGHGAWALGDAAARASFGHVGWCWKKTGAINHMGKRAIEAGSSITTDTKLFKASGERELLTRLNNP